MKVTGERFVPGKMFKHSEIEHMHRYKCLLQVLSNKIVLDAACGTGYGSDIIASVAKEVYGVDISQEAINYANSHFTANSNLKYIRGDITKLPFEKGKFDVVVSFETIEHVDGKMQAKFLKEIKRVLKPEGVLIISTPNKEIYAEQEGNITTEWHVKEFLEGEFKAFLNTEFENVHYFQQYMGNASFLLDNVGMNATLIKYDKTKKGKFIIAVAGNGSVNNFQKINSVYYYPDEYMLFDEVCQIYFADLEGEFVESNSQIVEVTSKNGMVNVDLEFEECINTSKIRIDPLSNSCMLKNIKSAIICEEGERKELITEVHNADKYLDGVFYFYHKDPQLIYSFDEKKNIRGISINFIIEDYNIDAYQLYMEKMEMVNNLEKIIKQSEDRIKQSEDRIKQSEDRIKQSEDRIKQSDEIIIQNAGMLEYERNLFYNRKIGQRIMDVFNPPRRVE